MSARDAGVEVISGDDAFGTARAEWDSLADRTGSGFCQRWAWVAAWHDAFAPSAEITLLVLPAPDGSWLGVLPVARVTRRIHRRIPLPLGYLGIAGAGAGAGDHLGPVVSAPEHIAPLVIAARRLAGNRSLYLESIAPSLAEAVVAASGGEAVRTTACPVVSLAGVDDVETLWTAKVRKNVRRRERMLSEAGIERRWSGPGAELGDALTDLRDVHERRWRQRGQAGLFDDRRQHFLVRLAELCEPPAAPWLQRLVGPHGDVVAALLGFATSSTFSTYKTGWDPAQHALGPGIALHSAAMRWALTQGVTTFDFMRGTGSHKYTLGATDRLDVSVLVRRGVSGAFLDFRERERSPRAKPAA